MRSILKVLALGAALTVSAPFALASTLSGHLHIQSTAQGSTFSLGANSITFNPPGGTNADVSVTQASGDLAAYTSDVVKLEPAVYSSTYPMNPQLALFSAQRQGFLFSIGETGASSQLKFYANSAINAFGNVQGSPYEFATFLGYVTDLMGNSNAARFSIVGTGNEGDFAAISGDLSTAPEPNSLILLGTGLIAAAGMMLRKRQLEQV